MVLAVAISLIAAILMTVHASSLDHMLFEQQHDSPSLNGLKLSPVAINNITWFDCPLYSSSPSPVYENNTKGELEIRMAECASIPLPLDYSVASSDSTKIFVFVKRLRATSSVPKKALWFLTGTPSSTDFEAIMQKSSSSLLNNNYDIYTMDHRGTGNSHRLGCVSNQAESTGSASGTIITDSEMKQCAKSLKTTFEDKQYLFSSSIASLDLASVILKLNEHYESTHVTALAYGTLWLSRFLQVIPDHASLIDSAIMDSVMSTSSGDAIDPDTNEKRSMLTKWDVDVNEVGLHMLNTYCTNKTICYSKLNHNPVQFLFSTFESLFQNYTCTRMTGHPDDDKKNKNKDSLITKDDLRHLLGSLLYREKTRELIPAVLYRLKRCDPDVDVPTLQHVFQFFRSKQQSTNNQTVTPYSKVWEDLVGFSELFPRDLSKASVKVVESAFNNTYLATGESVIKARTLFNTQFPIYQPDQYFNTAPKPQIPILMLNGDLDAKTPIKYARTQAANMGPTNVRLIEVPYSAHLTLLSSLQHNTSETCGMQMMMSFLNNDGRFESVDTSCLSRLIAPNFTGSTEMDLLFFGVEDIYEDAYEAPEVERLVNLYLFIGVEAGTVVASIIIICCLIYYIVQLKDKSSDYEEIEE